MKHRLLTTGMAAGIVLFAAMPAVAGGVSAEAAFEQLKSLAGTWKGSAEGEGEEAATEAEKAGQIIHEIRLSAAGTVVMETMGPGTEHEMINMYHVDGDDLVLTHYCAGGNQPTMRLDRGASTAARLIFDYSGGTNHDPQVDQHIHSADIRLVDGDHIVSAWSAHAGGEQVGMMTFHLARAE